MPVLVCEWEEMWLNKPTTCTTFTTCGKGIGATQAAAAGRSRPREQEKSVDWWWCSGGGGGRGRFFSVRFDDDDDDKASDCFYGICKK